MPLTRLKERRTPIRRSSWQAHETSICAFHGLRMSFGDSGDRRSLGGIRRVRAAADEIQFNDTQRYGIALICDHSVQRRLKIFVRSRLGISGRICWLDLGLSC